MKITIFLTILIGLIWVAFSTCGCVRAKIFDRDGVPVVDIAAFGGKGSIKDPTNQIDVRYDNEKSFEDGAALGGNVAKSAAASAISGDVFGHLNGRRASRAATENATIAAGIKSQQISADAAAAAQAAALAAEAN